MEEKINEEIKEEINEETKEMKAKSKADKKDKAKQLQVKIDELQEELKISKNDYLKAYADTENLKKRLNAEADNVRKYRLQSFALEALPVIDNFERALLIKDPSEELKNYLKGFEMIYQQLVNALSNEGVKEIDCLNKEFDPNYQQALMQEVVEGLEANIVVEVLQKGYMLKDRILRPALVKVSE